MTNEIIISEGYNSLTRDCSSELDTPLATVIIDGCNVAECEHLRGCVVPNNEGCKIDDILCCDNPDCYYKKLQRLKQENKCKHLVLGECSKTGENCIGLKQCLLKLERENEELKAENRSLNTQGSEILAESNAFMIARYEWKQEAQRLRKVLADIKEIANRIEIECISWTMEIDCNKCKDYSECSKSLVDQILAKIAEVENGC